MEDMTNLNGKKIFVFGILLVVLILPLVLAATWGFAGRFEFHTAATGDQDDTTGSNWNSQVFTVGNVSNNILSGDFNFNRGLFSMVLYGASAKCIY